MTYIPVKTLNDHLAEWARTNGRVLTIVSAEAEAEPIAGLRPRRNIWEIIAIGVMLMLVIVALLAWVIADVHGA